MAANHFRRVGAVRPSHLMFTTGIGALVDLPNFSVLVRGLEDWNYGHPGWEPIAEPRLLAAVRALAGRSVDELRPAPWMEGQKVARPASETAGSVKCCQAMG